MKTIAILGSGPSGLLAAWAASFTGLPIAIYSDGGMSRIGGAQYLHRSIPGLTNEEPDSKLLYRVGGDPATYQEKAYTKEALPPFVSFERVYDGLEVPAWNLRGIYYEGWGKLHALVNRMRIDGVWLKENLDKFELVVSSIPKYALCQNRFAHFFKKQRIRILNECVLNNAQDNTIYYDGSKDHSWYRASKIFGVGSTEWGINRRLPYTGLVEVTKPIETNCDCWQDVPNLLQVGRFGRWTKGVLTHHAFEDTLAMLGNMELLNDRYTP